MATSRDREQLFRRYVAIDWSGASTAESGVDLAVVEATASTGPSGLASPVVVSPPPERGRKKWSRQLCTEWLLDKLRPTEPRTLVLIDAGLAYPTGTIRALFGSDRWADLVRELGKRLANFKTARHVAKELNRPFADGAPFRFDDTRADARWYARHGVPYYRQTELLVPQTISEFYLGSGAAVGFHTITVLATLDALTQRREDGDVAFDVWPQEVASPREGRHVIAECYPALCRSRSVAERVPAPPRLNEHEADAMVACEWARGLDGAGRLAALFELREIPVGRDTRKTWREQVAEEGWILGA